MFALQERPEGSKCTYEGSHKAVVIAGELQSKEEVVLILVPSWFVIYKPGKHKTSLLAVLKFY